jgi:serine O-acetyltransferase
MLGCNSIILGDITIGNNCKIGAGSIVRTSLKDNSCVVGISGKVIYK